MPAGVTHPTSTGSASKQSSNVARKKKVKIYARLYGISPETLWGVYGTESGFGVNLGPSSAGAMGDFQFLPATAKQYHVNVKDFDSSARGAAHYLSDLGANGDPNSTATKGALNRYSGGGGGGYISKVQANGKTLGDGGVIDNVTSAAGDVVDAVTSPIDAAQNVFEFFTDPSSWLRIGKGALGFVFISLGTGALVFVIAKPIAKSVIGVSGTGKAVKAAAKSVASV